MYNKTLKENYLNNLTAANIAQSSIDRSRGYFEQFSNIEQAYNKDIATFLEDEYLQALKTIKAGTGRTVPTVHSRMKSYFIWCSENNHPCNVKLINMTASEITESIQTETPYFKNPQHLVAFTDKIFSPLTNNSMSNMYRAALYLLYLGLSPENIMQLNKKDFNFDKFQIKCCEEVVKIFPEFLLGLMYVWHQSYIVVDAGKTFQSKLLEGGEAPYIAGRGGKIQWASIRKGITRAFDLRPSNVNSSLLITNKSVIVSGILYKIYVEEQENREVNFEPYLDELYSQTEKASQNNTKDIARFYLKKTYKKWKSSYDL